MDKVKRLDKYSFNFFSNLNNHIGLFYRSTDRSRQAGINSLKEESNQFSHYRQQSVCTIYI